MNAPKQKIEYWGHFYVQGHRYKTEKLSGPGICTSEWHEDERGLSLYSYTTGKTRFVDNSDGSQMCITDYHLMLINRTSK